MEKRGSFMAKTIGIISIKGGVGKTTTVSNLGSVLANDFGKRVLLVDANFSAPNLGLHLGIVEPEKSMHHVLAGKADIRSAIHKHDNGFDVLPSSLIPKKIDPLKLRSKLSALKDDYDVVLLDSSPALNEEMLATMMASDELLVVTTPDYPTLSCTMNATRIAKKRGTPITGLILNKVRNKNYELGLDQVEAAVELPVLAVLPDEVRVLEALSKSIPASAHIPSADFAVEYKKLAAALIGENFTDARFKSKIKGVFTRNLSKADVNKTLLRNERVGE